MNLTFCYIGKFVIVPRLKKISCKGYDSNNYFSLYFCNLYTKSVIMESLRVNSMKLQKFSRHFIPVMWDIYKPENYFIT